MKKIVMCLALSATAAPIAASFGQDVYDTEVLSRHADVERQRQLLRATVGRKSNVASGQARATPAQQRACASKAKFQAQYGAQEPRVRELHQRCREIGL